MKRIMAMVAVVMMVFVVSSMAGAKEKKPEATLKLSEGQVGVGIGWSWGKGVLSFHGKAHSFKVRGLSVGDVGVTEADSVGEVYHLKKLSDFSGTYTSAAAQGTVGGGAGVTTMKNQNGVVIELSSTTQGVNIKLAAEGVTLTLEK